jgi:hypothetical protein
MSARRLRNDCARHTIAHTKTYLATWITTLFMVYRLASNTHGKPGFELGRLRFVDHELVTSMSPS